MKAWQLTTGLAILAIAAGQLSHLVTADESPPIRARPDWVVGHPDYGFDGPERRDPNARIRLSAIDAWIRDSRSVSACFFGASQTLGYVPDALVRLHVTESGTIDDVLVTDPAQLQTTDLEACLSRALRELTVPTYDGAPPLWLDLPLQVLSAR